MQLQLNGETRELPNQSTLADLLQTLELQGTRYAVEVNEDLIPRSAHGSHRLLEGDRIEIVQAIGGG